MASSNRAAMASSRSKGTDNSLSRATDNNLSRATDNSLSRAMDSSLNRVMDVLHHPIRRVVDIHHRGEGAIRLNRGDMVRRLHLRDIEISQETRSLLAKGIGGQYVVATKVA